jgi:hypothetical protein
MKQTAVQWYAGEKNNIVIQLRNNQITMGEYIRKDFELFEQAKEMERQQIQDAFQDGKWDWAEHINKSTESKDLAQYFNETYGGEK